MEITVRSRTFFENIRGTAEEAALFKKARVISVNSVRIPENPPFSKQYWTADNVLILRFDDVDDPDSEFQQNGRFMTEADAEAIAGFVESPDQRPIFSPCLDVRKAGQSPTQKQTPRSPHRHATLIAAALPSISGMSANSDLNCSRRLSR